MPLCHHPAVSYCEQTGQISKTQSAASVSKTRIPAQRISNANRNQRTLSGSANTARTGIARTLLRLRIEKKEGGQLNTNDIHYKEQLLYVRTGKGDKRRVIPMSSGVTEDLHNYYQQEREQYSKERCPCQTKKEILFTQQRGMRMRGMAANKILSTLIKRCGNKTIEEKRYAYTACATALPRICWKTD